MTADYETETARMHEGTVRTQKVHALKQALLDVTRERDKLKELLRLARIQIDELVLDRRAIEDVIDVFARLVDDKGTS